MLGLIKKDLLMVKQNIPFMLMILIFCSFTSSNVFAQALISITLIMSTFSYDEYNKTNCFITVLPKGRENYVKAKYFAAIIIFIVSSIVTSIISIIIGFFRSNLDLELILYSSIWCFIAVLVIQSFIYPILYKFGAEKGRIAIFSFTIIFVAVVALIAEKNLLKIPNNFFPFIEHYWFILLPLIGVISILASYIISKKIYLKREF